MKKTLVAILLAGCLAFTACGGGSTPAPAATTEATSAATTEQQASIIDVVTEAADGGVGEGEKVTSVSLNGKVLTITVDLAGNNDIAFERISSITDAVLALDDSYYDQWDQIVLDFGDAGKATLDKSMVVDDPQIGRYFDGYDESILK